MTTRVPTFRLAYEGIDITADLRELATNIVLVDKLEGEADTARIDLTNKDLRWMDSWLPGAGDSVSLELGYANNEALLGPIAFEIDQLQFIGPPDILRLGAIALPPSKSLRQRNSQAYEEITLTEIAQTIASKHNLELVGSESIPAISFNRITQTEQTDSEFLRDLAAQYGAIFKIESTGRLVFFAESDLEAANPILTLGRGDLSRFRIKRQADKTYKAATVSYQDSESGQFIEITVDLAGAQIESSDDGEGEIAVEDILRIRTRTESLAQAEIKAREALRRANSHRVQLGLELIGEPLLAAGVVVELSGFARFSGKYLVEKVIHRINRSRGYVSLVNARKVS